jgi:hypothetical protein
LVLDATVDIALGFLEEMGLDLVEDDFGDDGFFDADFDEVGFFKVDFLEMTLGALAAGFGGSDLAADGRAASCRWT